MDISSSKRGDGCRGLIARQFKLNAIGESGHLVDVCSRIVCRVSRQAGSIEEAVLLCTCKARWCCCLVPCMVIRFSQSV